MISPCARFLPPAPFFVTQIKPLFVADQLFVPRTFMLRSFDLVPLLLGLEKLLLRSILTSPDLSNFALFKANMYDLPQQSMSNDIQAELAFLFQPCK